MHSLTVPLNYNLISTYMDTRDNTQHFACKMSKLVRKIIISMRQVRIYTRQDFRFTCMKNVIVYQVHM